LLDVVEDALDALPEAARARIDYAGAIVQIPAGPTLIVSALVSALENGLKFSSGRVRVEVTAHAGHALVAVEDDGPGVPASGQEQLFAPFVRGHVGRADQVPGHGIGLAVIARVTKAHGGSARFAERPVGARLEMLFACAGDLSLTAAAPLRESGT
jgi:signal transduction histidine kinase